MSDQLDCIAVGAHPDDVEIGCGGCVARLRNRAIGWGSWTSPMASRRPVHLVRQPGWPRPSGLPRCWVPMRRITLDLPNRRLFDTFEARVALAKVFRRYRPRLVLSLGNKTPLASPDHYQAMLITEAAVFYTKLTKWEHHFENLPPRSPMLMYYFLAHCTLSPATENSLVVDIGDALEKKLAAIACYETQFGGRPQILDRLRIFNQQQGQAAGFSAGEVLASPATLATRDLMGMLFS